MKKIALIILLITVQSQLASAQEENAFGREISLRFGPQFGGTAKLPEEVKEGLESFIYVMPQANLNVAITEHIFASASFMYSRIRGKSFNGASIGHGNVYAPTLGIKVASLAEQPYSKDVIDASRWWWALELGPYITQLRSPPVNFKKSNTDWGFNTALGMDYYFVEHWGVSFEVYLHYIHYTLNDYMILSFGPKLIGRF